jgi:hypothetical protein
MVAAMAGPGVFREIKFRANGMLDPLVYAEINRWASSVEADIVEIGTAHGAATISAALGLPAGFRVRTVERMNGGSRARYGGPEENIRIIHANLARFGVTDKVRLHVGSVDVVAPEMGEEPIGMLILDADGCIDRDFRLFYDRLVPGAPIVIDDYRPHYVGTTQSGGELVVDQKHRITTLLVDLFVELGLIQRQKIINDTFFGRKPFNAPPLELPEARVLAIYRQLIITRASVPSRVKQHLRRAARRLSPQMQFWLKQRLKPTVVR